MGWETAVVAVVEAILLAVFVYFLLRYYSEPFEHPIYKVSIYISWYLYLKCHPFPCFWFVSLGILDLLDLFCSPLILVRLPMKWEKLIQRFWMFSGNWSIGSPSCFLGSIFLFSWSTGHPADSQRSMRLRNINELCFFYSREKIKEALWINVKSYIIIVLVAIVFVVWFTIVTKLYFFELEFEFVVIWPNYKVGSLVSATPTVWFSLWCSWDMVWVSYQ